MQHSFEGWSEVDGLFWATHPLNAPYELPVVYDVCALDIRRATWSL